MKNTKTTTFTTRLFNTALVGASAIAICAQQAFAFGGMGGIGAVGAGSVHVGAPGRVGSVGMHGAAPSVPGSITMNGITVLPNGTLIVPAVTPRVNTGSIGHVTNLQDARFPTQAPCATPGVCGP